MSETCPLCETNSSQVFVHMEQRYLVCPNCDLTFVNRIDLLKQSEEKNRYELHDNSIRSEGYLNFLYRLIKPININIKDKGKKGLDFGSGPYPMLLELLKEQGFKNIIGYDPFFNKNEKVWAQNYDFITCCEVIEHVDSLKPTFEKLLGHLEQDGLLVVSTGIAPASVEKRKTWHYISDPTHISMFSEKTIDWMAQNYKLQCEILERDLITFWKK